MSFAVGIGYDWLYAKLTPEERATLKQALVEKSLALAETAYGDLLPETKPEEVGNFGLRGSVCAGLTGRFAVSVAQVSASSNMVEALLLLAMIAVVVVRGQRSISLTEW